MMLAEVVRLRSGTGRPKGSSAGAPYAVRSGAASLTLPRGREPDPPQRVDWLVPPAAVGVFACDEGAGWKAVDDTNGSLDDTAPDGRSAPAALSTRRPT